MTVQQAPPAATTAASTRPLWPPVADQVVANANSFRPRFARPEGDLLQRFSRWPITRTPRAARQSLTALSLLVAAVKLPAVIDGAWSDARTLAWYHLVTVGWILLASIYVRTITPRTALAQWLAGIFVSGVLSVKVGRYLNEHVEGNAFDALVVPLLEEGLKVLPLLITALLAIKVRRGMSAIDFCVMGAAAGGGFALYEDMLWSRMFSNGFEGWGLLFPSVLQSPVVAAGHLVWSASIGLGIGVLFAHRRQRWAWVVGPLLIAVPVLDHMSINYRGEEADQFRSMLQGGWLPVWVLAAGIALVLVVEIQVVSRSRHADHLFAPMSPAAMLTARPPAPFSARTSPRQIQRTRNEAVFRHHLGRPARDSIVVEMAMGHAAMVEPTPPADPPDHSPSADPVAQ